jgi:hypothetical protein
MRAVGNQLGARTISLALVAGLVAFEAILALGTGAVGVPGVLLVRLTGESKTTQAAPEIAQPPGGESLVAKLPAPAKPKRVASDRAAKLIPAIDAPAGEPTLDGLADIPLEPWIPEKPKEVDPEVRKAAATKEALPWDAVEPFRVDGLPVASTETTGAVAGASAPQAPSAPSMLLALPAAAAVEGWIKAKASEIKGEERGRALYHFEFWLDAPAEVKHRLVAVAYDFNTPAVMPQSQISSEEKTGFRVFAGGLTCADKVTVTLKFNDGQKQQVAVDGCRLVDSA